MARLVVCMSAVFSGSLVRSVLFHPPLFFRSFLVDEKLRRVLKLWADLLSWVGD